MIALYNTAAGVMGAGSFIFALRDAERNACVVANDNKSHQPRA